MSEERELRDYVPFMAIKDGCVLSKRGDVTFGWKLWLPTAYTVNEPGYDSIIRSFMQAYKQLPEWCVVHKQDVFCYDRYHAEGDPFFLSDAYAKHFEGRRYLNGHSYLYVTFSRKDVIMRKDGDSGFFGIIDRKVPSAQALEEIAAAASKFEAVLKNNPLLIMKPLASEDFLRMGPDGRDEGVIPDYLRLFDDGGPDYNFDFFEDRLQYGDRQVKMWYVQDSDAYPGEVSSVKAVNAMSTGASKVFLSGGSPIGYLLRIPHVVNRYVLTLPRKTVETELDLRKRVMTSFSLYSAESAVNSDQLADYLRAAADNSTVTVKCFMDLMAWPTKEQLPEVRNAVTTAFQSELDVSVVEETRTLPLLHFAGIPSAGPELGYNNYLNSEITAFLCHGLWDGYDFGMRKGLIHVCDRTCRIPVKMDIQAEARSKMGTKNQNVIVVGPSGSGKSFTMNSLVQDFYTSDEHVVIIDVGDSYEVLCAVVREQSGGKDGVYNTYDPAHPFSFNPFKGREHWDDVDVDGERLSSGRDFIMSLLQTMYIPKGGWKDNKEAVAVLTHLVNEFIGWWDGEVPADVAPRLKAAWLNESRSRAEKNGKEYDEKKALRGWKNPVEVIFPENRKGRDPLFNDFYNYVSMIVTDLVRDGSYRMGNIPVEEKMLDFASFSVAMDMFKVGGMYGFLLNAEHEEDLFASRLTVFEVDKIKDNEILFPLWVLCIMHSFEDKMRGLPCQKAIVIEEAWKALDTPTMEGFILWLWRTARKFSTSAVVVTQDIEDLVSSDVVKGAIIQNSDIRILLDQRQNANNFMRAIQVLGLTPMQTNLVLSVGSGVPVGQHYKEAFFQIGQNYSNVFSMEVSPVQAVCFETNKDLKRVIHHFARKFGSYEAACKYIAEQGGRNFMEEYAEKLVSA